MCSGEPSDSVIVLKSRSNRPAPMSCDSRMIDENDMRYSTCAISSAMVCSAPLITCSVIGSTLLVSWVDCMRSPSGGEPVDVQRAAAADAGDVGGRHQRRRVVLDDDGGARHFVAGLDLLAVVAW